MNQAIVHNIGRLSMLVLLSVICERAPAQQVRHIPLSVAADTMGEAPRSFLDAIPWSIGVPLGMAQTSYPALVWPLGQPLGDDTFLSNYVDDDPRQGVMTDYMGGHQHLYDGHKGTDIATFNFRLMDKGIPIVAAAAGVVTHTIYHNGDRNTGTPYPDGGNGLGIQHDDGSRAFYWHIRTNSVVVEPGERVEAGQLLAYVASSGWTPIPHLHFELSGARDPWEGTFNTAPSLWIDQPAYVGNAPLWIMDMDIFTLDALGGQTSNLDHVMLKERVSSPAVFGSNEPTLGFWLQLQGNVGSRYTAEILQPDGQPFEIIEEVLREKNRYGWDAYAISIPAGFPHGTWTVRVTSGGRMLKEKQFEVGAETHYPPRFVPVAGRSIRLNGAGYQETLRVSPLGQPVQYHLVGAPNNVHLDGATLRIDKDADQPYRSRYFQVVATDAVAYTDTLWYHLVDPTKPFNPLAEPVGTEDEPPLPASFSLAQNYPNPSQTTTTIAYTLSTSTHVYLALYDLLGREVTALVDASQGAGHHEVTLDTGSLPSGLYTYRLTTASGVQARPLTVVR